MIVPSDVEAVALAVWAAGGLASQVRGDLKSGPGVSPKEFPYAMLDVRPAGQTYYTESGSSGGPYGAAFRVNVAVYGVGEKAVGDLVKAASLAFSANNWPAVGFVSAFPAEGFPTLEPDKGRKAGEDVWVGTLAYDVMIAGAL